MAGVHILGVKQAIRALDAFSRSVRTRGMRIGLSAAMGVIKQQAESNLRRHQDTGLLVKSQRVKVVVPEASRNPAHRDKPAYGLVGAGKGLAAVTTKRGKQKILTAKAKATARKAGTSVRFASRYSHFPEKKHGDLEKAARQAGPAAQAKFASKVGQFIQAEAAKQAAKTRRF